MRRHLAALAVAAVLAAGGLTACGSDEDEPSSAGSEAEQQSTSESAPSGGY